MFHLSREQKVLAKRFLVYGLMTFSVIIIVAVLIMIMMGYRFNREDGVLAQGGLVQFITQPSGVDVLVDDVKLGSKTNTKTTVPAGSHEIVMSKDNYRNWNKTIDVTAGSVTWLNYARMIPKEVKTVVLREFPALTDTLASPEGRWLAIKSNVDVAAVVMADLRRDVPTYEILDIPQASYAQPTESKTQQFRLVKWDEGERYILINHTYDGSKQEWLVFDREYPERTRSITKILDIEAEQVEFASDDGRLFFVRNGGDVRQIDLDRAIISRPLVTNVASFSLSTYSQKVITYVTRPDEKTGSRSVGYYKDGDDTPYTIRTYEDAADKNILVSIGRYLNSTYTAVANDDVIEILEGNLPTNDSTSSLKVVGRIVLSGIADELTIKGEGRFIYAKHGAQYATYDLEQDEAYITTLTTDETEPRIEWLDEYMVWSDFGDKLQFYEFDGANHQPINTVASGYDATISQNGKFVYSFNKTSGGEFVLQQVRLILN